jgi:hypothetical protein
MSSNPGVSNSEQEIGNIEDLAFFLASVLIWQAPESKIVVTGGGFISEDLADSNAKNLNIDNLKATHASKFKCQLSFN